MDLVLADDITGAAEVAGIAWEFGHEAWIARAGAAPKEIGANAIVVIDTDSRSLRSNVAINAVDDMLIPWLRVGQLLFKKTDSVLRGHVLPEIECTMTAAGKARCLLAPANPSRGRTIVEGIYYVDGRRLGTTGFARDPEFPAKSSDVIELLGKRARDRVYCLRPGTALPQGGVVVCEAAATHDVETWASGVDGATLPAGAADFFAAVLRRYRGAMIRPASVPDLRPGRVLAILGSKSINSRLQLQQMMASGATIASAPHDLTSSRVQRRRIGSLVERVVKARASDVVVLETSRVSGRPQDVRESVASAAAMLLRRETFGELYIEGGATASAILRVTGCHTLRVLEQLERGCVRVRPIERDLPDIILKPGSYPWPLRLIERLRKCVVARKNP